MNAHALRLALSNVREDGWLPGVCPDSGNPRATLVAANLFIPLILRDYLLYSGDLALIRELLPASLKLIELFAPLRSSDGLIAAPGKYWNFLDWSYELDGVSLDGRKALFSNGYIAFPWTRPRGFPKDLATPRRRKPFVPASPTRRKTP
jgi:hypothetical protein